MLIKDRQVLVWDGTKRDYIPSDVEGIAGTALTGGRGKFNSSSMCVILADLSKFPAYYVFIAKTVDENYWVDENDKSSTGFTVHSSNPVSVAGFGWTVLMVKPFGSLLLENGTELLLEDGTSLLLEG